MWGTLLWQNVVNSKILEVMNSFSLHAIRSKQNKLKGWISKDSFNVVPTYKRSTKTACHCSFLSKINYFQRKSSMASCSNHASKDMLEHSGFHTFMPDKSHCLEFPFHFIFPWLSNQMHFK
jgi:hypothetical protein